MSWRIRASEESPEREREVHIGSWGEGVKMTSGKEKNHTLLQERIVVTAGEEREEGSALW